MNPKMLKSNIDSLGSSEMLLGILDNYLILSKTDEKGKITFASQGFYDISGYSLEELLGKSHNLVRSEDTPKELFENLWETITAGKKWQGEIKNKKKDGSYYWVDATIMCEKDSEGNIIGYSALRHDITNKKELKQLNETLEKRISQAVEENRIKDQHLMQQTKAAQMGEMMDAVAHQWKQPLSVISLIAQSLDLKLNISKKLEPAYIKEKTKDIQIQINHLLDTIDTFRKFFRLNEAFESYDIKEMIEDAIHIMKSELDSRNIKIIIKGDTTLSIYCIKSEFIHTIINFINNAKDAFEENKIKNKKIVFDMEKPDSQIVLKVCDNAGGIPEHAIKNVFEANFTTKKEGKGTGIGLYMTKQILEKINAEVCVSNVEMHEDGKGACFIITI